MRWMLLALALGGCATAEVIMGPDGTQHVNVHCGARVAVCYELMAESCPTGYQMVDRADGFSLVPVNGQLIGAANHDFLIKCVPATAAAAGPAR